jgi:glycerol kinase
MVKATFGTGAFLLAHAGDVRPDAVDGLLTTVAWDLGGPEGRAFALEGAAFVAGAAIQWLVEELGVLATPREAARLAASVPDAGGAAFVPALAGLGSPWWDADARGALTGLSRGVTRAHVARAVVDALGFQGRAILEAMRAGGVELSELRADGGAATMAVLCQSLADGSRIVVRRPASVEATAIGAALCAALGVGVTTLEELERSWEAEATFEPSGADDAVFVDAAYTAWLDAVSRTRALAATPPAR